MPRKGEVQHPYQHAATASWWTEKNLIPPNIEAAGTSRKRSERAAENAQDYTALGLSFAAVLRGNAQQQQRLQLPRNSEINECPLPLGQNQQQV
jgi:hypothetical protein